MFIKFPIHKFPINNSKLIIPIDKISRITTPFIKPHALDFQTTS